MSFTRDIISEVTKDEISQTVNLLGKLEPGFLPLPIFEQVAKLVALPVVELVPFRQRGDTAEVLLIQRSSDDPLWPGMWHTPGTVVRATDLYSNDDKNWAPFSRLMRDELKETPIGKPHFVASLLHQSKRGVEQAQVYWAEVLGEHNTGQFFPLTDLPDNLIASQRKFIEEATASFERSRHRTI